MSNFLAAFPDSEKNATWSRRFDNAIAWAVGCGETVSDEWQAGTSSRITTFSRQFGPAIKIATTAASPACLMACGTWVCDQLSSGHEVSLLQNYATGGAVSLANNLEGAFGIVLANPTAQSLQVITDITGTQHLFYRQLDGVHYIAGSSLLLAQLAPVTLDSLAFQEFMAAGNIFEQRTLFQEIERLPPASVITFSKRTREDQRYWQPSQLEPNRYSATQSLTATTEKLVTAVQHATTTYDSLVTDITGGYDSRVLFGALISRGTAPACFVSGSPESADVQVAREIAERFGAPFYTYDELIIPTFDDIQAALYLCDGEYDIFEYTGVRQGHLFTTERGYTYNLNGSFGEIARGYWWELLFPHIGQAQAIDGRQLGIARYITKTHPPFFTPPETQTSIADHFAEIAHRTTAGLTHFPNTFQMDIAYLSMRMRSWQGRIASATDRIRPNTAPFQFRSVLELLLQTEWKCRVGNRFMVRLIQQLNRELASINLEHGYPSEPIRLNNAHRFLPLLGYYGSRAVNKLKRAVAVGNNDNTAQSINPVQSFWAMENIADVLSSSLKSGSEIDDRAIREFLVASQKPGFNDEITWRRLVSVLLLLNELN